MVGDKPPIVQEAENKMNFAKQDLAVKETFYQTKKRLKEEGLISVIEFQEAENVYQLAKIQVEIASKTLETVGTGLKNESVRITEAQLRGLRDRLALLRQKGLSFVLRAPFSGYIVPTSSLLPEELLILQRADEYLVQIPMKAEQLAYLNQTSEINVTDVKTQRVFQATLLGTLPRIEVLDNRQVVIVSALVVPDSVGIRLSTGISTRCSIGFGKINQREYIKRVLNFTW
jgi:hypothetical protein